jgi:hypothetical protein
MDGHYAQIVPLMRSVAWSKAEPMSWKTKDCASFKLICLTVSHTEGALIANAWRQDDWPTSVGRPFA